MIVGGPGTSNNSTQTPTQQMLAGDFSGLATYANAHNSDCVTYNPQHPIYQTTSCGWLNGPFQTVGGVPNQLVGALDPVAVQVTNDGLPGHSAAASGTGSPTSGTQI